MKNFAEQILKSLAEQVSLSEAKTWLASIKIRDRFARFVSTETGQ
jgi:hypothetical protein